MIKFHAQYFFEQNPNTPEAYCLVKKEGNGPDFDLPVYAETPGNISTGIAGKPHIYFGKPRTASVAKYFANTIEGKDGKIVSSCEAVDDQGRIFGDCKKVGTNDLILGKFSPDRKRLVLWLVEGFGATKVSKQQTFRRWCNGEPLANEC